MLSVNNRLLTQSTLVHEAFFSYSTLITLSSRRDDMPPSERLLKDRAHPRLNMINCQLRPNGVGETRLIQAFETVPREAFVPPAIQSIVYADADLPLMPDSPAKRWLIAPQTLGKLLQLAKILPTDKVLIIGCGTGYSVALVAQLAAHVIGVECDEGLAYVARAYAAEQEIFNTQVVSGTLSVGYAKGAPYDVIIIEGAVDEIPMVLIHQLSSHQGRLVAVVKGQTDRGQLAFGQGILITRKEDQLERVAEFDASCPLLPEFDHKETFKL
jgi:protein-L-isoaspartate(D-aspartate) O-methyltransferase